MSNEERFHLAGEEDTFKQKAGNLFSALDDVTYTPTEEVDSFLKRDPERTTHEQLKSGTIKKRSYQTRGRTDRSIMPPPRSRGVKQRCRQAIPSHVRNPAKFTKYTLADVKESDMSQKSNTAAAMAFLREIDQRQAEEEKDKEAEGGRIMFKKPTRKTVSVPKAIEAKSSYDEPSNADSGKSEQNQNKARSKKKQAVTLSHLEYEDE